MKRFGEEDGLPGKEMVYGELKFPSKFFVNVIVQDTKLEREKGLGSKFRNKTPLKKNECLAHYKFAHELQIKKGDIFYVSAFMHTLTNSLISEFNEAHPDRLFKMKLIESDVTKFPCKLAGTFDASGGKFDDANG